MSEFLLSAIIIDNDQKSVRLLKTCIKRSKQILLGGVFDHLNDAAGHMDECRPEVIFLDRGSSDKLTTTISARWRQYKKYIIYTTPDSGDGYRKVCKFAFGYLKKPYSLGDFKQILKGIVSDWKAFNEDSKTTKLIPENIAVESSEETNIGNSTLIDELDEILWIRSSKRIYRFSKLEIQYVEAMKDYVVIGYRDKRYIAHLSMSRIETALGGKLFIRVHRSWIISKNSIVSVFGNIVETSFNKEIPIGIKFKNDIRALSSSIEV